MDEVGGRLDGDPLGADAQTAWDDSAAAATAAIHAEGAMDQIVHLSFGDYPAREYFWQINGFRTLRAHDIAKVIGADTALPEPLVQGVWEEMSPHIEEWRAIGIFPAAVPVPEGAPLQDRLLGITGRQPDGRSAG